MTVRDVEWMNASAGQPDYSAADYRLVQAAILGATGGSRLLGSRSGVVPGIANALQGVHNGATPGTLTVNPGMAFIDGTLTIGAYMLTVEVAEVFNVPAAGSVSRTDRVWVRARDAEVDGTVGSNRNGVVEYVAGDAGTGAPPAIPNHALLLCEVTVPVAATPTATDKRIYTARTDSIGTRVKDQAEQDTITTRYPGMTLFRVDTGVPQTWDGSAWRPLRYADPPYARIHRITNQSIPDNASTQINFGTVDEESVSTFGDTANNRLVVPLAGLYDIELYVSWANTNATGHRTIQLLLNAAVVRRDRVWPGSALDVYSLIKIRLRLAAGDLLTAEANQNSTVAQPVNGGTGAADSGLSALWVRV